jgi:uncharacterized protein (DUF2336 family)
MRKKDVVLMATVTSFESLSRPSRSELRQFAELFAPLFAASSEEARRDAVAALSQSPAIPPAVAFFIGSQPIAVAAPFLIASPCLSNDALITIARSQGVNHARAIAKRESLSPIVIDALVGMRYDTIARPITERRELPAAAIEAMSTVVEPPADTPVETAKAEDDFLLPEEARAAREEELRRRIKLLAGHMERQSDDRQGLRQLSETHAALLVRFARAREATLFAGVLADALSASRWLAQRIMLDISGQQLATTLKGLFMDEAEAVFVLERFYGHLAHEQLDGASRATAMWLVLDIDECGRRLEAWRRADGYTYAERPVAQPVEAPAPHATEEAERPFRTSASMRRAGRGR